MKYDKDKFEYLNTLFNTVEQCAKHGADWTNRLSGLAMKELQHFADHPEELEKEDGEQSNQ